MEHHPSDKPRRIAFVTTRVHGTDGVSLEINKWADILERMGHTCFYIAGESDRPPERSEVIPEAHFKHPVIEEIYERCFGRRLRSATVSEQIHAMTRILKEKLEVALERFDIDLIIAENSVTIPMNIPLGLAIVETLMETGVSCIAHHHDFVWERERFIVNAVNDMIHAAFPPVLPEIQHVAINTQAAREFSRRTGLPCRVIPNVFDFERPPPPPDDYCLHFREAIGLKADDLLVLQPTRIIQRKGIENTIELVRQIDDPRCKLVITHASGDEGSAYNERVQKYAKLLGVDIIYAEPWIGTERGIGPDGHTQFTIWDAYSQADFISYPSTYEGFGNAFLEAIYYKKPVLCNRYAIYRTDIEPCGFRSILMDGFLTDEVIAEVRRVLTDQDYRESMVEHNYHVATQFFSYATCATELRAILAKPKLFGPCGS